MNLMLSLAWKSLRNRWVATSLTTLSIALSVALLLGVDALRRSARDSFANTISQVDLIAGARGGGLQLLLSTVFRLGQPTNSISWKSYETWAKHEAVEWTIPMALGDSHRGYRVVGTDENFYRHYRYRRDQGVRFADGQQPQQVRDVALGAEVAQKLGYSVGKDVVLTHGMGAAGILDHDDKPFRVVGILQRTATPIDRSLFITLEGVEAIHEGWEEGVPAAPSLDAAEKDDHDDDDHKHADHKHADHKQADHKDDDHDHAEHDHSAHAHGDGEHVQLSAFLLRTKNRVDTLRLMREINTYTGEPMTAIIPGVTLNDLWSTVSYVETALKIISIFVVGVGLCGMLVALYTTLNERRREMAILRAVGAGPGRIAGLFILESGLLALAGIGLGIAFNFLGIALLQGFVEQRFGLYLRWQGLTASDALVLCILFAAALLIGLIPAWRAYRNSLADGLSVRI